MLACYLYLADLSWALLWPSQWHGYCQRWPPLAWLTAYCSSSWEGWFPNRGNCRLHLATCTADQNIYSTGSRFNCWHVHCMHQHHMYVHWSTNNQISVYYKIINSIYNGSGCAWAQRLFEVKAHIISFTVYSVRHITSFILIQIMTKL